MATGVTMGNVRSHYLAQLTATPVATGANSQVNQAFVVHGARIGDVVFAIPPANVAGLTMAPTLVTADRSVNLSFVNSTGGSLTGAAGVYTLLAFRPDNIVPLPVAFAD